MRQPHGYAVPVVRLVPDMRSGAGTGAGTGRAQPRMQSARKSSRDRLAPRGHGRRRRRGEQVANPACCSPGRSSTSQATACRTRTSARVALRSPVAWQASFSSLRGEDRLIRRRLAQRRVCLSSSKHVFPFLRPGGRKLFHDRVGWHRAGRFSAYLQLLLAVGILGALIVPRRRPRRLTVRRSLRNAPVPRPSRVCARERERVVVGNSKRLVDERRRARRLGRAFAGSRSTSTPTELRPHTAGNTRWPSTVRAVLVRA